MAMLYRLPEGTKYNLYNWSRTPIFQIPSGNQHSNGTSPYLLGNTSSNGPFSIAMLVYRRVIFQGLTESPETTQKIGETLHQQGTIPTWKNLEGPDFPM